MIKFNLFLGYSIVLIAIGSFVGWTAHQKVSEIRQNPFQLIRLLGANHD